VQRNTARHERDKTQHERGRTQHERRKIGSQADSVAGERLMS